MGFALAAYFFSRQSDDATGPRREIRRPHVIPMASSLSEGDAELVARIRAGDTQAFAALMTAYYPTLSTFVRRYAESPDAADDVLQDLFVRIWERRATWEVHGSLRAYLFIAARNSASHARARLDTRRRAEERGGAQVVTESDTVDVAEVVEQEDLVTAVRKIVAGLPERCREIFRLSREHGLSYSEIAEVLGISVSTVKTQMGRAMVVLDQRVARLRQ